MSHPLKIRIAEDTSYTAAASRLHLKVARLTDLRSEGTASSVSPVVMRGLVRLADFLVVTVLGLLIAVLYVNEPYVAQDPRSLAAIALTGLATLVSFELLGLYTLRVFTSFVKKSRMSLVMPATVQVPSQAGQP